MPMKARASAHHTRLIKSPGIVNISLAPQAYCELDEKHIGALSYILSTLSSVEALSVNGHPRP